MVGVLITESPSSSSTSLTRPFLSRPHFSYNLENHSAPPDVTGYTNNTTTTTTDGIQVERAPGAGTAPQRQTPKYGNAELMETGDGESGGFRIIQ